MCSIISLMGELSSIVLRPVIQRNHWRVEMAWSGRNSRYFGHFLSRTGAEKWIEEHRWLAKQSQVPDEKPSQNFNYEQDDD